MKVRIGLLCCAFLLALVPAVWASPDAPAPAGCATDFKLASVNAPQGLTQQNIERLNPLAGAQETQSTSCCTQQDWDECVGLLQPSCFVEEFYCYQGQFCYCGIFCY
jgi:hypothetical protein